MSGIKVLITNHAMVSRAGTEMYVYDLALALQKLGHRPYIYTPKLGQLGKELEAKTIPVTNSLDALAFVPDIIHGHHHLPLMTALTRFPNVPALFFCHGWTPQEESPPIYPRILRYGAVSETCRDRLLMKGVSEEKIEFLLNFVDLERFQPRSELPKKPKRALIFSNHASEEGSIPIVRQACEKLNITLDVVGAASGKSIADPERILGSYDLVFAVGKAALEALAVGASVIVCDYGRIGSLVSMENVKEMRQENFGLRTLSDPLSVEAVCREIEAYDCEDAQKVSQYVRETACKNKSVDQIVSLYRTVLNEYAIFKDQNEMHLELIAVSKYLASSTNEDSALSLHDRLNRIEQKLEVMKRCYRFLLRIPGFGLLLRYIIKR